MNYVFDDGIEAEMDDKLIWKGKMNGHYSIKNSYILCVEELIETSTFEDLDTGLRFWGWEFLWISRILFGVSLTGVSQEEHDSNLKIYNAHLIVSYNANHEHLAHIIFEYWLYI